MEQLSGKYSKEALFLKVDVDKLPDVSQGAGVSAMPSFGFYGDGRLVELQRGGDPRGLEDKIKKYSAQFYKTAFTGSGYTLGGPGSGSTASAPSAAPKPSAAAAATPAPAPAAGGAAAGGPQRRNPWADPNFMPGKKPTGGASAAASSSSSASTSNASSISSSTAPSTASARPPSSAAPSSAAQPTAAAAAAPSAPASSSAAPTSASSTQTSSSTSSAAAPATSSTTPVPVNAALLEQMIDMGFSRVRAEKALLLTHNVDTDSAVGWLVEHQEDADIDEPLQVVGSAPRPSAPGVNVDELDEDERVLYEELMRKKGKETTTSTSSTASTPSSASAPSAAAAGPPGAKRVAEMSSEEKMQWLADKKAAVKAKKETEALEKVKSDYKSTKGMTSALNDLKEQREEHERQQAMSAKRKETADKEKQRREIAAKLQADKDRRKREQEKTMAALQKQRDEKAQANVGK